MSWLVIAYPTLSDVDRSWLQAIRKAHDRENWTLIAPHFTLVFPFDPTAETAVREHVRAVGRRHRPFRFILRRITVHENAEAGCRHLFAEPKEGRSEIIALHDDLYSGMLTGYLRRDLPYRPHITIATCENSTKCEDIIEQIGRGEMAVRGIIGALYLVCLDDDGISAVEKVSLR